MYCPSCGAENEDPRPLCYRCGVSLRSLEPLQSRLPMLRGKSRFLRWLLLSLLAGLATLAIVFAILFSLAPDPQPLPTPAPTWQVRQASSFAVVARPSPEPTAMVPAGITGCVVDHNTARPVANARVIVGGQATTTDESGCFALAGLAPGQYVVVVSQVGYAPRTSPVISVDGKETRNLDIVLYPETEAEEAMEPLGGNALSPEGAPTEDDARRLAQEQGLGMGVVDVSAATLRGKYWVNYRAADGLCAAIVTLDEPGWVLTDDRGQAWRIVQRGGGLALPVPAGWTIPTSKDGLESGVHLSGKSAQSQIEGQIFDEASDAPIAGAEVTVGERQATTDADGRFAVADLAPGAYTVLVSAEGYDPMLSGIVNVAPGEQATVSAALPLAGQGEYPRDPMASNQIDPAGAPSAQEAERLARLQGLQGDVNSIREVMLDGEYLVNYKKGNTTRAAAATLNHPGWELVDAAGQSWYVVRVCGNLAVARQPTVRAPAELVSHPHPVVTVGGAGAVGRACSAESCDVVAELPAGWHGTAVSCSSGCGWLQVQGPGVSGTCWVQADLVQAYGNLPGLPVGSLPQAAWIAYDYQGDIWLIDPDGSDPTQLTDVGNYHSPAWSPDGKKIVMVYSSSEDPTIPKNLHVVDVTTGRIEALTHYADEGPRPAWVGSPDWSPDGTKILYEQSGDGLARVWDIVLIGSDGSQPGKQVPVVQGYSEANPSWAPDGEWISYSLIKADPIVQRPLDNWGIWIARIDGTGAQQMTFGIAGNTSWSSDGTRILHDHASCLASNIYVIDTKGAGTTQLTHDGSSCTPDWSPGDSQIAFMRCSDPGACEIWIMNADGSDPHKVTDGYRPAWQPVALPATSPPSENPSPSSSIPEIRWTEPELIGNEGQGGPTQQLLLDHQGRLWAFWEEHVAWQPPDRGYDAVHYRVWEDNAWGDLQDIPGSDNYGEPTAALLPDGRILVKAETTTVEPKPYLWFLWDGSRWSTVPEMESLMPLNEGIRSIAADSHGFVHVMGYPTRTWDGTSWREGQKLGTILFHATALDIDGVLHAVGSAFAQGSSQGIRKWTWDGTSWSVSGDIYKPSSQEDGGYSPPALAIGLDGTFHAVWSGSGPLPRVTGATPPLPRWVSYSTGDADRWSKPRTLFGPVVLETGVLDPNLAVAPDGMVIVVWGDVKLGPGYRAYATWGREGQWAEPIVLSPEDGDEHMWPVVAMDAEGRVHIMWKARKGVYHRMGTIGD